VIDTQLGTGPQNLRHVRRRAMSPDLQHAASLPSAVSIGQPDLMGMDALG
jgi:hypothetical protein